MSVHHEVTGIILKKVRSKNNDKTVVLFSQELGKLYLVAKGAQKITSKRLTSLDSLNVVRVNFNERLGFMYIREVDVISRLQTIKDSYEKRRLLLLFAEVLDKLLPVNQCEIEVYKESVSFLQKLSTGNVSDHSIVRDIYQLLLLLGYSHMDTKQSHTLMELQKLLEQITEREIKSWQLS
ncbi:MAG: DNA repair protein RecO [Patescibacteria group bacterium]|jgi:DNA repair protein RecO (recombination protein O)